MGWRDAPVVASWKDAPVVGDPTPTPSRSEVVRAGLMPEVSRLGRQVGLTARAGIQGAADLLAMPGAMIDAGVEAFGGKPIFRSREAVSSLLDKGFPKPENAVERVSHDVAGGLSGGMGMIKIGGILANYGREYAMPALAKIGDLLATGQTQQLTSIIGGTGAASTVKESGGGTGAQLAANVAGGIAAPMSVDALKAVGRATMSIKDLLTDSGRQNVVGNILRDSIGKPNVLGIVEDSAGSRRGGGGGGVPGQTATPAMDPGGTLAGLIRNPEEVVRRLENVPTHVKGSNPTTAQAAASPELAILERGLQSANPRFAAALDEREALNNAARQAELRRLSGGGAPVTEGKKTYASQGARDATAKRDTVTAPLRESALDATAGAVHTDTLLRSIRGLESQPGKRAIDVVSNSLREVKDKIAAFTDKDGFIHPEDLYAVRSQLGNVVQKNAEATQNWDKRLTGGLQHQVQRYIDNAIESAGGAGWKDYLAKYSTMSKPIEQMETIGKIRQGAETARVMPVGPTGAEYGLSQAKFKNLFTNNEADLSRTLSPAQMDKMRNVAADLDRGSLSATQGRSIGSNTMQNLSTAYVLGSVLGAQGAGQVSSKLATPLRWLTSLNSVDIEDLLGRALLNPALAKSLMTNATPRTIESIAFELQQTAKAAGIGTATSSANVITK